MNYIIINGQEFIKEPIAHTEFTLYQKSKSMRKKKTNFLRLCYNIIIIMCKVFSSIVALVNNY